MIVQFRNEKVSNHGSIPITIDCNVVAFIVFEEGFHQPIKRTKHESYVEEEVKIILDRVISDRKERERSKQEEKEREEISKQEERETEERERETEERMDRKARQHELELSQQNQPLNDESGRRVEIGPKIQLTQITTKFDENMMRLVYI
ncbi:hypothetical protein TNCV_5139501 [Trichonephila clavipes]|nr:hypothetical protein TNCV_5139501 [Trichonephila clavipes]